ncbi:MAG: hypothetical protein ACRDOJ_08520, partial [Nocardioidaceae bacterium]
MTSHLPRVLLALLAAVTLVLTVGGAVGLWQTGAPASRWDAQRQVARSPESGGPLMRPAAKVMTREMEGGSGDVRSPHGAGRDAPADTRSSRAESALSLPARSGLGRRVVFDMGEQRVWLVGAAGAVRRTYPVSGSQHRNLS